MSLPRSRRTVRSLAGAALLACLAAAPATANEADGCELGVEPRSARAGSQFTLAGMGYTPAELSLEKRGGAQITLSLDLAGQDPFSIPVSSKPGDEGVWTATVTDPSRPCSASATFRVTLLDTWGVLLDAQPQSAGAGLPAVIYLLVIVAGFGGGVLLARHTRAA